MPESQAATLLKKRLWHGCFPVNLVEIFKSTIFTEHVRATASTSQCNSAKYEFENSQEYTYARVSFLLNFYLLK